MSIELKLNRKTWVVDHADDLAELERRLNHLDEEGFQVHSLYRDGPGPAFVVIAFRFLRQVRSWLLVFAGTVMAVLLCLLRDSDHPGLALIAGLTLFVVYAIGVFRFLRQS